MQNKIIIYGNRGMTLENDINITNEYYNNNKIALIYKKPIPIKVIKVNYAKTRILDGFYETQSTLDYNGIYKEKYIEFDAKETRSKTSYPLSNIHAHQLEHIKNVLCFKGIVFLIIRFVMLDKTYLVMGNDLINYIINVKNSEFIEVCRTIKAELGIDFLNKNDRKSIPLSFFEEYGHLLTLKYTPRLDYLSIIDKILTNN